MRELNNTQKNFVEKEIVTKFDLTGLNIALEKLYWHALNDIYDEQAIMSVLTEDYSIDTDIAKSIASTIYHNIKTEQKTIEKTDGVSKETVSPMRTMAGDMEKVHGYGSIVANDEGASSATADEEPVYKTEQTNVLQRPAVAATPTYDEAPTEKPEATEPEPTKTDVRWSLNYSSGE